MMKIVYNFIMVVVILFNCSKLIEDYKASSGKSLNPSESLGSETENLTFEGELEKYKVFPSLQSH